MRIISWLSICFIVSRATPTAIRIDVPPNANACTFGYAGSGLAAGTNDTFRQTGVAVGIAALGTLVPADAALGGDLQSYVDGLHHALIVSAVVAAAGAIATAWLLLPLRRPAEAEAAA